MNKDVIYIDVDDDVTAIIGKIKAADEKIVALVPPKRAGALQSAVNMRLLDRMAKASKKHLVLITTNQALVSLAASAQIPVAKNLQSKPEVAEIPALVVDDADDIIDGADLPVGDHARTVKGAKAPVAATAAPARDDVIDTADLDLERDQPLVMSPVATGSRGATAVKTSSKAPKNKAKIPNFDTFRKKLVLIISGAAALIALLVWMFVFAPAATVVITARTTPTPVTAAVALTSGTGASSFENGTMSAISQQEKKDLTIEFEATGQKDIGDKATGSMKLTRTSVSSNAISVPAGTIFTASGVSFVSTESTTLAGTSIGPGGIVQDTATVPVRAEAAGDEYNLSPRSYDASVSGFNAQGTAMTGGTSKIAKVVSSEDVDRARAKLIGESTDSDKAALIKKFANGEFVIEDSFTVERGSAVSSPAVDEEAANGKAKLTIPATFSVQAVAKTEIEAYLREYLESKMGDTETQKIYSTGADKAGISNFRKQGDAMTATLTATGYTGPRIDEDAIKEQVKGKIYGEVQQSIQMIDGVKDVDVQFSFFWVRTVPNDTNKIKIEFKVENE